MGATCLRPTIPNIVLAHTGSDFIVAEGAFIGRIVSLGRDFSSVTEGLDQGRRTIETTFSEETQLEHVS